MKVEFLQKALALASTGGLIFVATSDNKGWPHIAAAGKITVTREKHVLVTEWFCPVTMKNLQVNPRVSVVIRDAESDTGYQIIGELEEIHEVGVLNGYSREPAHNLSIPQVERQLLLHVDKVFEFKRAAHSDTE
jgi:hypothetical protein